MDDFELLEDLLHEPRSDERVFWYDEFGRPSKPMVGQSVEKTDVRGYFVSTVLLSLNHAFRLPGIRIFETMIFKHERPDEYQWRYSNMMEALLGHEQIVAQIEAGVDLDALIVGPFLTEIFEEYREATSHAISVYTAPEGG